MQASLYDEDRVARTREPAIDELAQGQIAPRLMMASIKMPSTPPHIQMQLATFLVCMFGYLQGLAIQTAHQSIAPTRINTHPCQARLLDRKAIRASSLLYQRFHTHRADCVRCPTVCMRCTVRSHDAEQCAPAPTPRAAPRQPASDKSTVAAAPENKCFQMQQARCCWRFAVSPQNGLARCVSLRAQQSRCAPQRLAAVPEQTTQQHFRRLGFAADFIKSCHR